MHYDNALMNSIKGPSLLNLKNLTPGFVYHVLSASITTQIRIIRHLASLLRKCRPLCGRPEKTMCMTIATIEFRDSPISLIYFL